MNRVVPPTAQTVTALVLATTDEPPTGLCAVARLRFEDKGTVLILHDPMGRAPGGERLAVLFPYATAGLQQPLINTPGSIFDHRLVRVDARAALTVGDAEGRAGLVLLSTQAALAFGTGGWRGTEREEHVYVVPTRLVSNLAEEDRRLVAEIVEHATPGQLRTLGRKPVAPPDDARSAWEARVDLVTPTWLMERLVEVEVEQAAELARPSKGRLRRLLGLAG